MPVNARLQAPSARGGGRLPGAEAPTADTSSSWTMGGGRCPGSDAPTPNLALTRGSWLDDTPLELGSDCATESGPGRRAPGEGGSRPPQLASAGVEGSDWEGEGLPGGGKVPAASSLIHACCSTSWGKEEEI